MVHVPSTRVYAEMVREPASVWFLPARGTDTHATLLKAPMNILKALVQGCRMEFVFGLGIQKDQYFLCTAAKVYDDPVAPFIVSGVQLHVEEHTALRKILSRSSTPLYFFDELNRCVAWTNITFDKSSMDTATHLVGSAKELHTGSFDQKASRALDNFDLSLDENRADEFPKSHTIPIVPIAVTLSEVHYIQIAAVGSNEVNEFILDDKQEGKTLEQTVWHILESTFELDIYKSPQIQIGANTRELTDIFCFTEYGLFLFETKAISVYSTDPLRKTQRRTKNVQKQVKKALEQLKGAIRGIRNENRITSNEGIEFYFDRSLMPHAIVLVSELLPFEDWDDVVSQTVKFARDHDTFVHILDLRELSTLMRLSEDKHAFDYLLIQRFNHFFKLRNIFIRVQPLENPT